MAKRAKKAVPLSAFPNLGVSLAFLQAFLRDQRMARPVAFLLRPDLDDAQLEAMDLPALRTLAKEARTHSGLDGDEEFACYADPAMTREAWLEALRRPPTTTTQVNVCIIKPATRDLGGSYAATVLAGERDPSSHEPFVGNPTDFVSHAWRYCFADLVASLLTEAEAPKPRTSAATRYYWNDIFVEDQNSADTKPDGYFFAAFRKAVQTIGRTVLVLQPLRAAIPLTRSWCVWEIFCAVSCNTGCELVVALPPSEKAEFERVLLRPGGVEELTSYVVAVNAQNSKAFKQRDKDEIDRTIVTELGPDGFNTVNSAVCERLRAWLQEAAMGAAMEAATGGADSLLTSGATSAQAGLLLLRQGHLAEAEPLLRFALEARERTLGADHADTLISVENLARLLRDQGKWAEVEPMYRRALEARERTLGADHADTLASVGNIAVLLRDQGKLAEAEGLHRRALEGLQRTLGADHARTVHSSGSLGLTLLHSGSEGEGRQLVMRALTTLRSPPHSLPEIDPWIKSFSMALASE
jgi:hypothetical protein